MAHPPNVAAASALLLLALAGCGQGRRSYPAGRALVEFDPCFSLVLPIGFSFTTPTDQLDSALQLVEAEDFSAQLSTGDGPSLPVDGAVSGGVRSKRVVGGRAAEEVSGHAAEDVQGLRTHYYLSVSLGGSKYMNAQIRCREGGCGHYRALIDSLAFAD
jgi:hypothetical protein